MSVTFACLTVFNYYPSYKAFITESQYNLFDVCYMQPEPVIITVRDYFPLSYRYVLDTTITYILYQIPLPGLVGEHFGH